MLLFFMYKIDTAFDMLVAVLYSIASISYPPLPQRVAGDDKQNGPPHVSITFVFSVYVCNRGMFVTQLDHVPDELILFHHNTVPTNIIICSR